ncbi:MAG TPA: hypothetical protein VH331_04425 [Allosphingosinicella sp.]|jgi:hypothetical protein|nr:hypothetical protein [Allosphingosinicella sp.]
MGATAKIGDKTRMASRWRRRRMCVLVAGTPAPAALRDISASAAFLETNARPALGSRVQLQHPEAGIITGIVSALSPDGVHLAFDRSEQSAAFALAAIAADMSRPA